MDIRRAVRWAGAAALVAFVGVAAGAQQIRGFSFTVIGVDGNPVVGAKASLTNLQADSDNVYEGTTDARGEFMKTGISYSEKGYKFAVEVGGATIVRYVHKGDADLKSDDTGERKILLTTLNQLKVDLRKAFTMDLVVKDEAGAVLAGAKVTAKNLDDETKVTEATADAKGVAVFADMPFSAKGYTFTIERAGKPPVSQSMILTQVGTVTMDLDLSKPQQMQQVAKANPALESQELFKLGDYEGALAKADEALANKDEEAEIQKAALLIKGQCLDKLSRPAEALKVFEEYTKLDPANVEVVGVLSRLAEQAGEKNKAAEYQKKYLAMGGKVTGHNFNKGVEAFNAGDIPTAVKFLEMAVKEDPSDADSHKALAMAYGRSGNPAGVVEHLKTYLKLRPDDPERATWEGTIAAFEPMIKKK